MVNMKKKKQRHRKPKKGQKRENVSVDENKPEVQSFLYQIIGWFSDHQQLIDRFFSRGDTDRSGSVNLKDFELGLMKLDVPCQQLQLHMLIQLLKTSDNSISYQDLGRRVQTLSDSTEIHTQIEEDFRRTHAAAEKQRTTCLESQHQQRRLNLKNHSRFIRLSVRLVHFDLSAAHPGNFEVVLLSSCRVLYLIRMIQDRVGIQTSRMDVFGSRVPTEETRLPLDSSLEECGFKGGPEESPPEATVYYDYKLLFTDCPILNCDHYFQSEPDSAARRSGHCL